MNESLEEIFSVDEIEVNDNIKTFIKKAARGVYAKARTDFLIDLGGGTLNDTRITSPIEQLFITALHALCVVNNIPFHTDLFPHEYFNDGKLPSGVYVIPQFEIGQYRVDFLVTFRGDTEISRLIVELDSQKFHERTEKERRYEKARDRFLARQNIQVYHYTGKEVTDDPFSPASEVLKTVSKRAISLCEVW